MTYPKMKDCPKCGRSGDSLAVYGYDNGCRHVECDGCYYLGPAESSIGKAIKSHNADLLTRRPMKSPQCTTTHSVGGPIAAAAIR